MLRELMADEDGVDLDSVVLSHYRISAIRQQNLAMACGFPHSCFG